MIYAAAQGRKETDVKPHKKAKRVEVKNKEAAKAASAKGEVKVESSTPRPQKLKVLKKEASYRGARQAWHQRLVEFDGKTEGEFLESVKAKPPSLTRNGTAEPPSGWVRFFVRQGVLSLHA